jgi:DNA-binding LytR/AlgR family response regulator
MIKCIVVDDSPLAIDLLEDYIGKVNFLKLEKSFTNALEAIGTLEKGTIDLIFLDIQMPDITGIDLLKGLTQKPKVIFTTAYSNYAFEGFELDVSDYLLKPFSFERFMKAVNKVKAQLASEDGNNSINKVLDDKYIFVKSGYESVKIFLKDIQYIEALKDYIQIYTNTERILSLMSMKDILEVLPQEEFVRIHRSHIVPLWKVSKVSAHTLTVEGKEMHIGDVFRDEFIRKMDAWNSSQG